MFKRHDNRLRSHDCETIPGTGRTLTTVGGNIPGDTVVNELCRNCKLASYTESIEKKLDHVLGEIKSLHETPPPLAVSVKTIVKMLDLEVNNGNLSRIKKMLDDFNVPKIYIPNMSTRYDINDVRALLSRMKRRLEK